VCDPLSFEYRQSDQRRAENGLYEDLGIDLWNTGRQRRHKGAAFRSPENNHETPFAGGGPINRTPVLGNDGIGLAHVLELNHDLDTRKDIGLANPCEHLFVWIFEIARRIGF
jgi:hypothetical protein